MRAILILLCLAGPAGAADVRVERFGGDGAGSVNSFILDAGAGAVVVDAQRTLSQGRALADRATAGDRAVAAILITHPHPDHVGGLASLEEATQAPIYGSSDTAVEIGADTRKLLALTHRMMPDETVASPPVPGNLVSDGEAFEVGGIAFEVVAYGEGEAADHTVYVVPSANLLFPGDLVTPGRTPFLLERNTGPWLEQLDDLAGRFDAQAVAYPGHGEPGPLGPMIAQMRDYLTTIRGLVAEAIEADGSVDADERSRIVAEMTRRFPDFPPVADLDGLLERNVVAVAEELTGEWGDAPVATLPPP